MYAPKIKTAFSHAGAPGISWQGISGWWIISTQLLKPEDLAEQLKAKQGGSVTLDPMVGPKGMLADDEKWLKLARDAVAKPKIKRHNGKTYYMYISDVYSQRTDELDYEDPALFHKSTWDIIDPWANQPRPSPDAPRQPPPGLVDPWG